MQRPAPVLHVGDEPVLWLGANFWSRAGGPLMWRTYDDGLVRSELAVLAEHGLDMTRSFFYWPDFMPQPGQVDEKLVARFADFLDSHTAVGMRTVPTFIVGHMSGENWDPAWRGGRDLYGDTWLVAQQAWFVEQMTARFRTHPAVTGWLVSNEMPIYGGEAPQDLVTSWARLVVQAVRAGGSDAPVSVGDGAWGIEVSGHDNGYSVRALAAFTDWVGPHVYKMETDQVRQHLKAAFTCELSTVGRLPVVMEEFGLSSDFASEANAAHYYRQTLHTSLLAGARGWIAWNNTDFDDLIDQDPYRHHPFELHFGITTHDGTPKAALHELARFREVLDTVDLTHCTRLEADTALVLGEYAERDAPVAREEDRTFILRAAEQAHVAAREADLALGVVREVDGLESGYRLYLLPATKQFTGPGWRRLGELAEGGATVYVSYSPGESPYQRGPWWTLTESLFGVRHSLRYGLVEPVVDDVLEVTFEQDLGPLTAGTVLRFPVAGTEDSRSLLPLEVTDGTVVARDQHGRPVLVVKEHGAGRVVLSTFAPEHFAARRAAANPEPTWSLYDALAELAGVRRPVRVDDPRVLVDGVRHRDGHTFHWLVNASDEELTVTPRSAAPLHTTAGEPATTVTLPPFGVQVLREDASA